MIAKDNNNLLHFSIDTIDRIIEAKNKGKKIIESCENKKQLDAAKKYVDLYSKSTEDLIGTSELEVMILSKRQQL
tara:strand:- start:2326 stop:2550 length:225 start_codon:yes stop_codon:yes gene_type:complete